MKKLNDKWEKYIFLDISDHSKGCKLYNLSIKKIIISRNVIFYEVKFWTWSNDDVKQNIPIYLNDKNDER